MVLAVIVGVLALVVGLRLGRALAPETRVVHHSHKDEKAVFDAYLKGMRDYAELMRDAAQNGLRLSPHPKDKSVMNVLDPRIPDVVGEVRFTKKCKYNIEMYNTPVPGEDRPQGVPAHFIKIWDNSAHEYTWVQPT
jgi:hypothetical protein